jgi:hypothetical protein
VPALQNCPRWHRNIDLGIQPRLVNDSDNSDLAAGDSVDKIVGIAGKDQFARSTMFGNPSQHGETGELFSLADDVIHDLLGGDGIVG